VDTLRVRDLKYSGFVESGIQDWLHLFSYEFAYGKSYLLNAELGKGAWALCWIIGGMLKPDYGEIRQRDDSYTQKERYRDAWFVVRSEAEGFRANHRTVKKHIQHGLKTVQNQYLRSEEEIIARFLLTPERYVRPIRPLSHERWRASCAIGLAHSKKIFCFPYVEYLRPYLIEEYYNLWLKSMIDLLRDSGALVLVPAIATGAAATLCDEVVQVARIMDYPASPFSQP
jgi:hypothetical protein